MTEDEATAALKDAGATHVRFQEEFPYSRGCGVEAFGQRHAVRWSYWHDGVAEAVEKLTAWIALAKTNTVAPP